MKLNIQEKIQSWKNEVERAERYGYFFDTQSMREVINTVEEQQKEIDRLNQCVIRLGEKWVDQRYEIERLKNKNNFFKGFEPDYYYRKR